MDLGLVFLHLAHNFTILLIGPQRMIQGIGTNLILFFHLMFCAVVMQIFPPETNWSGSRNRNALVIMFALPSVLSAHLTGLILALGLSWQWIFWLFIPFYIIALIFAIALHLLENVGERVLSRMVM